MLVLRRDDGTAVMLGHVADVAVAVGDRVKSGQPIARVGNNGPARAPHIHIGAYRGRVPLQIRWDQKAMARLRRERPAP
ncbi:MAG TPA: M23 family metallopeptidase [Allosphingosinicella sp.]|jgi:murein DD-endopeptidase MepM/ murein hydrolase activator NlpD